MIFLIYFNSSILLWTNPSPMHFYSWKAFLIFNCRTYNRQWAEGQAQLKDLMYYELPLEPPKPEKVIDADMKNVYKIFTWL